MTETAGSIEPNEEELRAAQEVAEVHLRMAMDALGRCNPDWHDLQKLGVLLSLACAERLGPWGVLAASYHGLKHYAMLVDNDLDTWNKIEYRSLRYYVDVARGGVRGLMYMLERDTGRYAKLELAYARDVIGREHLKKVFEDSDLGQSEAEVDSS